MRQTLNKHPTVVSAVSDPEEPKRMTRWAARTASKDIRLDPYFQEIGN